MGEARRETIPISKRALLWIVVGAILVGFVAGRTAGGGGVGAAATEPNATATRSAELAELDRLRTQVAQTAVCSPAPSATATGTPAPTATATPVPPAAMGQPLAYVGDWTVVVKSFTVAPSSATYTPVGKLLQVSVTVTNNAAEHRALEFRDWSLVDEQGRTFQMSAEATSQLYGPSWYLGSDPSLPADYVIAFDVAVDAGPAFVLESTADPTFRVAVQVQLLG
jgi:hypothetical protein